jgi:hypothetical protein
MRTLFATIALALSLCPLAATAGLEVSAYEGLTKVENPKLDRDGEPVNSKSEVRLFSAGFPQRFLGLEQNAVYEYRRKREFLVGSHTWYGWWRNELAKLAGYRPTPVVSGGKTEERYDETVWKLSSGPFYELIDFSDAEGALGPVVCAKLHKDFVEFKTKAMRHPDKEFRDMYTQFERAFRLASKNGAVVFE